ncbi:hypothetical protein ACUXCC_005637 [Cytobacillus horneckiae]|uniref:hypothetical protein n=1 Tax=Cytobacillus horneckiae TaxID=549687 RepID=UPI0019D22FA7|nr:hypothetical protein [Cytobacillus horneckiae]MBN6890104.1 hypothetical protein [Cytobacillus horneckiae]
MSEIKFIERKDGILFQNLGEWDNFKESLFSMAKSARQLEFIGQLVEDLQCEYEERYEELYGDE